MLCKNDHKLYAICCPKLVVLCPYFSAPALSSGVQVAGAKPFAVQADVLQREQESYLRREPTPENSPLLLLQVRVIL